MKVPGTERRPGAGRVRTALGVLLASFLASCAAGSGSAPPPQSLQERLRDADPLHPAFERFLSPAPDLFECLLAIDSFVFPQFGDAAAARNAFDLLCRQARADL